MVQSEYGRPPVLDRLIEIDGDSVWAARRDFTARDTVETGQPFSQISLSYARFIVRAGVSLMLGSDFTDDDGNQRRIEGVSKIGRGQFIEILGRSTSFTPVDPVDPVEPVVPVTGTAYRWDRRPFSGQPSSEGQYRVSTSGDASTIFVNTTDADDQTFSGFTIGDVLSLVFTNGHTATGTVTDAFNWSGFGGQTAGPAATFTPEIDITAIGDDTVGVTITITDGG